jgi:hypothetical protein
MRRSLTQLWTPQEGVGRVLGNQNIETGGFTAANGLLQVYRELASTNPVRLLVTPSVDCWWPIRARMIVRCATAAWGDIWTQLALSPADADGQVGAHTSLQSHNALPGWTTLHVDALWKLAAATAYTCSLKVQASTGGIAWHYHHGQEYLSMLSPGIVPR